MHRAFLANHAEIETMQAAAVEKIHDLLAPVVEVLNQGKIAKKRDNLSG